MAVAYYVAARLSLLLIAEPEGIAVFWLASGIAAGVMVAAPRPAWPGIMAAVVAGTLAANIETGKTWPMALIFAVANAIECLIYATLLRRFERAQPGPTSVGNVLALFASAVIAAVVCGAAGAFAMSWLGLAAAPFTGIAQLWARSDGIGIIVAAPFIAMLFDRRSLLRITRLETLEGCAAVGLLLLAAIVLLGFPDEHRAIAGVAPDFVMLPLIVWIAGRAPPIFAAAAVLAVSLVISGTLIAGIGIFGNPSEPFHERLLAAQLGMLAVAFCTLILSAMFTVQRAQTEIERRLVANLEHSVKNILSRVIAIMERSFHGRSPTYHTVSDTMARIKALARAHARITSSSSSGMTLTDIAQDALSPHQRGSSISIEGDALRVGPRASQAIALVLHELATNAAKHGSLSRATGRVRLCWRLEPTTIFGGATLILEWTERGGPIVHQPIGESFGLATIRGLIPHELGGSTSIDFAPDGFTCQIRVDAQVLEI